ncbi:MAG TPA: isochorismatase family protein [Streptosporangiaceae bacterium]
MEPTVLLVMDVQAGIVARLGDQAAYLGRLSAAVAAARQAGIPVVYVTVAFRDGHPEVSARNKTFAAIAGSGAMTASDPATAIHQAVAPRPGDPVVIKRRVSAFAGSDLDVLLRGLNASRLVLTGIATSGVVLSTLRQAADLDYAVTVLSDACADRDEDVHATLIGKIFPRQADVLTVAEWTAALTAAPAARALTPAQPAQPPGAGSGATNSGPGLADVLRLERIEADLFRSSVVYTDPFGLYGGQVAAQALRAAAQTVPAGRQPHSLHGYFLSRGDPSRRVLLMVNRDRDGRSYSNRRVIAVQNGVVIFNMAASFHVAEDGPDYQAHQMPDVPGPAGLPGLARTRMLGIDIRVPPQPSSGQEWPSRVWMRTREPLAGETEHACALTYISDMFTGLASVPAIGQVGPVTSIDHAVWFHRRASLDDWVLMDLLPESTSGGRGMYTGRIFTAGGALVAGIAQESLFRPGSRRPGPLAPER